MDIIAVIALALAPGLFWFWYFMWRGRLLPRLRRRVIVFFFVGVAVLAPALLLEKPFSGNTFLLLVFAAPVLEESLKLLAVAGWARYSGPVEKPQEGALFALATALGFATAENVYTIVIFYLAPQLALGLSDPVWAFGMIWKLYLLRALLTVPGHALWSALWGYALGVKDSEGRTRGWLFTARALALAVVLHGLFNLMLLNFPPGAVGMLVLFPLTWWLVMRRMPGKRGI